MRKIRKRVFAAVLAAVLFFTMPGMASYVEAETVETEYTSESITVQADADGVSNGLEELERPADNTKKPEADDSNTDEPETGDDDTEDGAATVSLSAGTYEGITTYKTFGGLLSTDGHYAYYDADADLYLPGGGGDCRCAAGEQRDRDSQLFLCQTRL